MGSCPASGGTWFATSCVAVLSGTVRRAPPEPGRSLFGVVVGGTKIFCTTFRDSPQSLGRVMGCDTPHRDLDVRNRLVARRNRSLTSAPWRDRWRADAAGTPLPSAGPGSPAPWLR